MTGTETFELRYGLKFARLAIVSNSLADLRCF